MTTNLTDDQTTRLNAYLARTDLKAPSLKDVVMVEGFVHTVPDGPMAGTLRAFGFSQALAPVEHLFPRGIRNSYELVDVASFSVRGDHAHLDCTKILRASRGSFLLSLTDGEETHVHRMNDPNVAICVPPLVWLDVRAFTDDAVCHVLASATYHEEDYIRGSDRALYDTLVEALRQRG